jgi:hypothetical protein
MEKQTWATFLRLFHTLASTHETRVAMLLLWNDLFHNGGYDEELLIERVNELVSEWA